MFTTYAEIKDGQIVAYPVDPHVKSADGTWNVHPFWQGGQLDGKTYVFCHNQDIPCDYTQAVVEVMPKQNDETGLWYRQYELVPATAEVIEQRTAERAEGVRNSITYLCTVADNALSKPLTDQQRADWQTYRSNVVSLLTHPNFPWGVVLPDTPDEIKPVIEVTRL